jgi:hypothetical protein
MELAFDCAFWLERGVVKASVVFFSCDFRARATDGRGGGVFDGG